MNLRRTVGAAAAAVLLLGLAACSNATSADSGSAAPAVSSNVDTSALFTSSEGSLPATGPKPVAGKKVWWISCSQASSGCGVPAARAQEAAKAMGWNLTVADGKFNVGGGWATAIRTAIAARPDAMVLHGIPCDAVAQPISEAVAAKIVVVFEDGVDCVQQDAKYLPHMVYSETAKNTKDYWTEYGRASGKWIAGALPNAKIIDNAGTEGQQVQTDEGMREEVAKCSGCKIIATVKYSSPDLTPEGAWIKSFRSALVKNPDATAVYFPFDLFGGSLGGVRAVEDAGLKVITFGSGGLPDSLPLVRQGRWTVLSSGRPAIHTAYAALDNLNRVLQGQPMVPQGMGFTPIDKTHNLPAGDEFTGTKDWKAQYEKLWSTGSSK